MYVNSGLLEHELPECGVGNGTLILTQFGFKPADVVRADYVLSSPQVAGESEVSAVVSSAMLASDDVLNVIGKERLRILRQATVFAAITSPFEDSLPEPLVHQVA